MGVYEKLAYLLETKNILKEALELDDSIPFREYVEHLDSGEDPALMEGTLTEYQNKESTQVGPYRMYKYDTLKKVTFDKATKICSNAFTDCVNLDDADFHEVKTVEADAFSNCLHKGGTINLPECTSAASAAFKNSGFQEYNLPKLQSVEGYTFESVVGGTLNCGAEILQNYSCIKAEFDEVNLPNCLTIERESFNYGTIRKLNIPNLTTIGARAFTGAKITSTLRIQQPVNVWTYGCMNLDVPKVIFEFPAMFDTSSMNGCKATAIVLASNEMSTMSKINAFTSCNATFYVPAALRDSYLSATNWSTLDASRFLTIEDNPGILED